MLTIFFSKFLLIIDELVFSKFFFFFSFFFSLVVSVSFVRCLNEVLTTTDCILSSMTSKKNFIFIFFTRLDSLIFSLYLNYYVIIAIIIISRTKKSKWPVL